MSYRAMQGLQKGVGGFIRETEEGARLTARGLWPGERYTLFYAADGDARALCALTSDRNGGASATAPQDTSGEWLLARANGEPVLYAGENLPAMLWLLERARKKDEPKKEPEKEAAAPASPRERQQPEAPRPKREAPAPIPQKEIEYDLRDPGEGAPVDALPTLLWPGEAKQFEPYFERFAPVGMALPIGWRCVRVRPENGPTYILGRREMEDRVDRVLFAQRYTGGVGQTLGETLYGADGAEYRALYREISGAARSGHADRA